MSLLQVVRMGDPVLRRIAAPVADPADPAIAALSASMIDAMVASHGVGLAAPQIGRSARVIVMRIVADRAAAAQSVEAERMLTLVNPELETIDSDSEPGWEGCLSVPELRGVVRRLVRIGYRAWLPDGQRVEGVAEGFQARILQHEVDHLDGILYLDRMDDFATLGYGPEIQAAAEIAHDPDEKL